MTVSEAAYRHALGAGVPRDRLRLIRNAVDGERFAPPLGERAPGAAAVVGFVGRLSPEKHPRLFVRMAARVHEQRPDVRFVLVGDGPLRASLEHEAAELGVADAMDFLGERRDVDAVLRSLDVLVLTSWHEGTPLAVLEAMATGVPVAATDVGGVPELVRHRETGLLFPAGDEGGGAAAVLALLEDGAWRRRLGAAARSLVLTRFGWAEHVRAVTALWQDLAMDRRRQRAAEATASR